ncbi:Lrp/AsnC family transcriptional regulator [Actinotalea sp. Marseille-Q4924]|uniref:Lrp/AsnC family transcriptional regulator n=1 Tax=Actinotalea sp. Marseille-Q4924 TaxID=2866571 RepID=UPI001CE418B8|nr:Lrp/AsnC family transcriptional regulator [Actinotalea sp. Marseille-Q4924]
MDVHLDETDRRILHELTRDGRMSVRALAEAVNVSRSHAYSRIERLQAAGVLEGFTAVVDPVRSGLGTSAYVTLSVRQSSWRDLSERLRRVPEVKHMALVGGGDVDVILLVRTRDNEALRRVVLDVLQGIPGVLSTRTLLIFEDMPNR